MTPGDRYIAIDWGTTNRRAYLLDPAGAIIATHADERGILTLAPHEYEADIASLRASFDARDVIAAGMVGSTRGWHEIPYVEAPAALSSVALATREVAPGVRIVPGVALRHGGPSGQRADVMRGEEVQALGGIAAGLVPPDALVCQPGTHNKWIETRDGRIVDFATAMTGELFALVRAHGVLAGMLDGAVRDGPAFRAGVERGAATGDLAVALFEVRAAVLLGTLAAADAAAFASGVLIGADVGARAGLADRPVHLLASGGLSALYGAAITACGGTSIAIDGTAAFVAGIHAIREYRP